MTIQYFPDLIQGSDDWLAARCGLLTASEIKLILTPTLMVANNDKDRAHLYELLAQRITGYVEPHYMSDDMLRGHTDEAEAIIAYSGAYAPVTEMGFITNSRYGFTLGFSPDGLVGTDGFVECKARRQKYQVKTIIECLCDDAIPAEFMLQIQTGFLVSERKFCDFISYSGGLPMVTIRVLPDSRIQDAILAAAASFESRLAEKLQAFQSALKSGARLIPTERRKELEMYV